MLQHPPPFHILKGMHRMNGYDPSPAVREGEALPKAFSSATRCSDSAIAMSTNVLFPMGVLPIVVLAFAFLMVYTIFAGRRNPNLPPGPRPVPLIGNLHQLPPLYQHTKFAEWAAQYG